MKIVLFQIYHYFLQRGSAEYQNKCEKNDTTHARYAEVNRSSKGSCMETFLWIHGNTLSEYAWSNCIL